MIKSKQLLRKSLLGIILIVGLIAFYLGNTTYITQNLDMNNGIQTEFTLTISGFWNLTGSPIEIDGDATGVGAHNWTWAVSQDWCSGLGTEEQPYIIENVTINADPTENAIWIQDSNGYFRINNCTLLGSSAQRGIRFDDVVHGAIENCEIQLFSFGITFDNVNHTRVMHDNIHHNTVEGGYILDSNYNLFSQNNLTNHNGAGLAPAIYLGSDSCWNNFTENRLTNNKRGLYMVDNSNFNHFKNNEVMDNTQNGIEASGVDHNLFYNNSITRNAIHGIQLIYSSNHNDVISNYFLDNGPGVSMMENASGNYIEDNHFEGNNFGIYIYGLGTETSENIIQNNQIHDSNLYGIYLWGNGKKVYNNTIQGNFIQNSGDYGIYFRSNVTSNRIIGNTIYKNLQGIRINLGQNNTISNNILKSNTELGIFINRTTEINGENLCYSNTFMQNGVHAIDESTNNFWNNTDIGNLWDNYTGTDIDFNGIGDQPHNITGGIDYLPIYKPFPQIDIILPYNNSFATQDAPPFLVEIFGDIDTIWYTINNYTSQHIITSNGTIDAAFWQSIWNDFVDGQLIFITFYVNDTLGRMSNATLQLVVNKPPQGIPGYEMFIVLLVSGFLVGYFSINQKKKRSKD
ncbi:MAG: hypothetical protein EU535_07455 [Promethearchaeota archaeon]|nr:MAG: hypothetical protein EU535_07455 [Candidatus Lokiarchaeota archaeon]